MKEPILLNYENGVSNSMVCYDLYLIPQWASPFSRADNATCSLLNAWAQTKQYTSHCASI